MNWGFGFVFSEVQGERQSLLPQPPTCWDDRCALTRLALGLLLGLLVWLSLLTRYPGLIFGTGIIYMTSRSGALSA